MPRISTDNYDTVASWNGSQDLFIVEQSDGTKVATPAMVKQYVLGNSIDDIYSVMGQNGAKNLIHYPYPNMSTTVRGITWSDNGDGGIVGNGTGTDASAQPYCELNGNQTNNAKDLLLKANTWYTLTCKRTSPYAIGANIYFLDPSTMLQTSITFDVIYGDSAQTTATKNNVYMYNANVVSEEVKFKLPQDMYAQVQVRYKAGTDVNVSNDVQYPMLRLASDTDNTYQPYAKTNKQLTEIIGDLSQTGLTGDSLAGQVSQLNDEINELSYSRSGLTTNAAGTIVAGGYFQIGKLVVVNLRIRLNDAGAVVYGLPKPAISDSYNAIGGVAYNSDRETVGFYYLGTGNGNLSISTSSGASGTLLISFVYAAQ